jgi:hypothetical protein
MMRALFIAAIATASYPAGGAPAPDYCSDVRLVVSAARANPPFSTLPPRIFEQGHMTFGLAWPCRLVAQGRLLHCTQYVTRQREAETMAAETARCLPEARRDPDESGEGGMRDGHFTFPYYRARFYLAGFKIEISRHGDPGNHLGQFVTYDVILDGAR